MNSQPTFVFSRLFLPSPLPVEQVAALFARFASDRQAPTIILETRADESGIQHLLGCEATQIRHTRRLLRDLIPGTTLTGLGPYTRPTMRASGHIRIQPPGLPLAVNQPEDITRAIYSALGRKFKAGEAAAIQLVLGAATAPRIVPAKIAEPGGISVWQALTTGVQDASSETRGRMRDRAAKYVVEVALRIGVTGPSSDGRRRLAMDILSGISIAQSPGVKLRLVRDNPNHLNMAVVPKWWPTRFSVPELIALSAWPIGDEQFPGMPPIHPKMLRAAPNVHTGPRVFAESLVPGDDRQLGVAPKDALFHGFAIGPTGVGKTTMAEHLMEADIARGAAVLVLDPKDQIPDHLLARIPKERWPDVVVIDAAEDEPIGFNPLDATGRDPDVVADSILAIFEKTFREGWGPRTADIFSASLRTLARSSTPEHPNTLMDLPSLWTDGNFRRSQIGAVADDVALMGFWAWYGSLKPNQQANVIASPMNKLRQILLRPAAVKILGQRHPGFRLRDIFRERRVVLVPLNEGLIGPLTAEFIGSLVIAEAWQATQERASEKDHERHPGFIYVDEADRFMNLPNVSLADALARSRSLSVSWFLATQFWDQLPKEMKSAIKSNARTKAIFKLESDDDARTIARLAPELTDLDFMSLDKYQVYVRLVADGVTTNWALAKTLPPSPRLHDPADVRRVAREHHRARVATIQADHAKTALKTGGPTTVDPAAPSTPLHPALPAPAAQAEPITPHPGPIGRKRRTS
jgi:hypothetical protein